MNKNIFMWIGIVGIVGLLAYGVSVRFNQQNQPVSESSRKQIVASFYPLAYMAERIGGEYVDVLNLTPAGSEPHDFDPSPRDIAALQNAQVFIYNGVGLEARAPRVISELTKNGVRVIDASGGLELIINDPHVWLDPILVKQQVKNVANIFAEVDSEHGAVYQRNADVYIQELEKLHQDFTAGLSSCKRSDIVTSHAAFAYLAKRYNLSVISIAGLSPDSEPSPSRLAEISRFVRLKGVTHIFFEILVSPKIAETIAKETGAQALSLNPLEGLTDEEILQGKNYISVQRENLQALKIALDCI